MPKPKFNLDYQYALYLQRMKLSEATMHTEQKRQVKQAFMGAWGQLLMLMHDEIADLSEFDGVVVLEDMTKQVERFWIKDVEQYKARNQ